jgi:hypothetical protein
MQRFVRTGSGWLSLLVFLHSTNLRAQAGPEPPRPQMTIAVVEGEGAINNVRDRKPANIVVVVRDGNRRPIPGASITFTIPTESAGAAFADGSKLFSAQSDKDGYASVQGIRPNNAPGPYQIKVEAQHKDETATAAVTQFNMEVASGGGSGKWVALAAIVGAAAAGGAIAVSRGGGNGSTPATTPTSIGIAPGSGTVGPPR